MGLCLDINTLFSHLDFLFHITTVVIFLSEVNLFKTARFQTLTFLI